jgi:hypothetical protein
LDELYAEIKVKSTNEVPITFHITMVATLGLSATTRAIFCRIVFQQSIL